MTLRWKRWGLRCSSLLLLAGAVWVMLSGLKDQSSNQSADGDRIIPPVAAQGEEDGELPPLEFGTLWQRPLRKVLFDPPPPPPKVVKKPPPPPLNVTLRGTMIDESSSQAIIEDSRRNVLFRKVGESVSPDRPEAIIESILPSSIEVRQGDQMTTLNIE